MPIKPYTLEEIYTIIDNCVSSNDRITMGNLAEVIAEDGNLYDNGELDRIILKIETEIQKLN